MAIIPICQLHVDRSSHVVTIIRFARDPEFHVSVPVGAFLKVPWDEFSRNGVNLVRDALQRYFSDWSDSLSQFETTTPKELKTFFKRNISFLVCDYSTGDWQLDLMRPTGDGTIVLPLEKPERVQFNPREGSSALVDRLRSLTAEL